jgi:hypothetical protein
MIRPLSLSLAAGIALATAIQCGAGENFPVIHNDPITVRILGGRNGKPLANSHLILIAGYDTRDIHEQLYRQESLTDAQGQVRLSKQLANLPWLQVWVNKKMLCQTSPRAASFSVELIRRDGVSAPNRCGTATTDDAPGVFNVFVKSKAKKTLKKTALASVPAPVAAPIVIAKAAPIENLAATPTPKEIATEAPVQNQAPEEAASPAPQAPTTFVAVVLPFTLTAASLDATLKTALPVLTMPARAVTPSTELSAAPSTAAVPSPVKRVARKSAYYRGMPTSYRARPVEASCQAPPREEIAESRLTADPANATGATRKPKPAAGVRINTARRVRPNHPMPKHE